ncbi:hypothetical protein ACFVUH_08465 [Kitasatospora sp. NPDC058032]|uniref:hypothetical protein n=1 Tax=Kitasatospora sp. NPDC058032 TaxID=3346307 RepID=UPI0036DD640B
MHGVAVTGLAHATYQHRRLLGDYGFTPLQGSDDLVLTARTDNIFIHARQAVVALRSTGAAVKADPAFDYEQHPGHASPAAMAAGPNARIVTPSGLSVPSVDVAVGTHPEHGIVATNHSGDPAAAKLLAQHGFYRTPGHPTLFALTKQDTDGVRRAAGTVAKMRAAGLNVTADLPYEPAAAAHAAEDPFQIRIVKVEEKAPAPPAHAGPDDPFLTRVIPVERPNSGDRAAAEPAVHITADPFATRLHPAPAVRAGADSRTAALLANRQQTLATIEEILAGLSQQLRDDPQALDPVQVSAVLEEAQSTLGGVRRDLDTITAATSARPRSAAPAVTRPAATATLGARAQAARATSLRLGRVSAAQPVEAAAQPVDPRQKYSIHIR